MTPAQIQAAEIELGLPRTEMDVEIERDILVQPKVPFVLHVAQVRVRFRLIDSEVRDAAGSGVADIGLELRHVISEVSAQEFLRAAAHLQIAGAHVDVDMRAFGSVALDYFRFVLHGPVGTLEMVQPENAAAAARMGAILVITVPHNGLRGRNARGVSRG